MLKLVWNKFLEVIYEMLSSVQKISKTTRADKLLLAAFVVAFLRQVGVNGHFIGWDPASNWGWFAPMEALSGMFMAALEGIALAYISKRWRKLQPKNKTDWVYWSILLLGMLTVFIFTIIYVSLYAFAAQRGQTVSETFAVAIGWNIIFNITVAAVNPLIALLIGIVEDDQEESSATTLSDEEEAMMALVEFLFNSSVKYITPAELARYANVSEIVAAKVIKKAKDKGILPD